MVRFLIVPLIGETFEPVPPAVKARPLDKVTLDHENSVVEGTVPFTPSTGTVVNGTSVHTVVE